jgi:hypothetical protein
MALLNFATSLSDAITKLGTITGIDSTSSNYNKLIFTGDGRIVTHGKDYLDPDSLISSLTNTSFSGTSTKLATSAQIQGLITELQTEIKNNLAANDAMVFKGTIGTSGTVTALPSSSYSAGWTYKVITAGTYAGIKCEVGDMIIAITDATASQTAINNAHWTVVQANIDGAVTGPSSSLTGGIAVFLGDNGREIACRGELGSATKGMYLKTGGIPAAMEYTLGANVPSDAVFTDTHYTADLLIAASSTATSNVTTSTANPYIIFRENSTNRHAYQFDGVTFNGTKLSVTKTATVVDSNPTLDWGTKSTVGTVDGSSLSVTMPANPHKAGKIVVGIDSTATENADNLTAGNYAYLNYVEDSKVLSSVQIATLGDVLTFATNSTGTLIMSATDEHVTSAANHYTPSGGSAATVTTAGSLSDGNAVVTGVTKDAAGHVTGVTTKTLPSAYSLPTAKYNVLGGIKPNISWTTAATLKTTAATKSTTGPTIQAVTTTSDRYYAVEVDKNGVAFVNVPWTNTQRDIQIAGTSIGTDILDIEASSNIVINKDTSTSGTTKVSFDLGWYNVSTSSYEYA